MPRTRNAFFKIRGQRLAEAMADIVTGRTTYQSLMTSPGNYLKVLVSRKRRPSMPAT